MGLYIAQGDSEWAKRILNKRSSAAVGCFLASFATAINILLVNDTKQKIDIKKIDAYLDRTQGYVKGTDIAIHANLCSFVLDKLGRRIRLLTTVQEPNDSVYLIETTLGSGRHFICQINDKEVFDPAGKGRIMAKSDWKFKVFSYRRILHD